MKQPLRSLSNHHLMTPKHLRPLRDSHNCWTCNPNLPTCVSNLQTVEWETASENKWRPILVQGLRRDTEINFHINNIYGSVTQWISAWLWIWRTPVQIPVREIFFTYSFKEEMNQMKKKKNNNNNSSNSLVFGRWPQTKSVWGSAFTGKENGGEIYHSCATVWQ